MLSGNEIMKIQNMTYRKSALKGTMGTLSIREDGIAFYKVKGAALAQAGFGLLGALAVRNNESAEAEIEVPYSDITRAEVRSIMMTPTIEVTLSDGSSVTFLTQSRIFNGKSDLERAVDTINGRIH